MTVNRLNPGLIVALLVAAFASLVLTTAYSYSGISGAFPRLIGWIFLGLALLEVAVQVRGMNKPTEAPEQAEATSVLKEIKGFSWLGLLLVLVYLLGFLISTPLYIFAFLRFSGGRHLATSAVVAAGATVFVYVVFVLFLEYRLYPGILMG